jgi:Gram-negative bacterial TonB protein C-terminal/Surface antigen variable number repeat
MKVSSTAFCLLIILLPVSALAQSQPPSQYPPSPTCAGEIHPRNTISLTQRAKITLKPAPVMTQEALSHDVHGGVVLEGVLCRTGRVTDLQVIEGLPYGMTARVVEAAMRVRFIPAQLNGQSVSQKIRFEYLFNVGDLGAITTKDAAHRLVETIEVVGNRRWRSSDIMSHVQTKLGDFYDEQQVQRDLDSILATGYFNRMGTRVSLELGIRGGVVIVFEVQELPVISAVKFQGLEGVAEAVMVELLLSNHVDVRPGAILDPSQTRNAIDVIRKVLEANGQHKMKVEVRTEAESAANVRLDFIINRE